MFRNLRSRRRPRYGLYACAAIAALLLLLSVTVLHSSLTFSRGSDIGNISSHLNRSPPSDDVFTELDQLVDDPDPVVKSGANGGGNDDRIDELDFFEESDGQSRVTDEEEILRGVDFDEDESDQQTRVSGYYFDHTVGVIRRAFDKRSIDQWEDYAGFDVGLVGDEYKSKEVFGSDDEPVDEDVRRKAAEVTGVEDALLLKTDGRVSPLREGWGPWFDAKSDFLRRDKMFKSNLELLNPLNNPMLQDPDVVGVTGVSRGDKLVLKGLLDEFKKVPFLVNKPVASSETVRESKKGWDGDEGVKKEKESDDGLKKNHVTGNMGARSEIKKMKRRTLGHNASTDSGSINIVEDDTLLGVNKNGKIQEKGAGELKNAKSNPLVKTEFSGHVYADGKRWGYFPGFHPHLSFSNFMNAFFRKGKCSMRVFMVWNSPPWMYSVRHQRGLESLLLQHPEACVVVFSETLELDFFADFVKEGYKVAVVMPDLDELLKGTPTHVFASVWFEWKKTKFYSTHYSELVRLAALYKYGGIYLDSDIVVLNSLSRLNNSVALEDQQAGSSLNGAVMAFTKHSPFILECLKEFYSTYDDTLMRWNGAELLTRAAKTFSSQSKDPNKKLDLKVLPSFKFFPVDPHNMTRYFTAPATEAEKSRQDSMFRQILDQSLTFHFWSSVTSALVPEQESLAARLINYRCIRCSDVL